MTKLFRVQVRGIRGQPLLINFSPIPQMRLHGSRSMRWCAIPNQDVLSTNLMVYALECLRHQIAINRSSKVPLINLAAYTQPNGGRNFTPRTLSPQDRWFAAWRPRMGYALLKRPADFIIEDDIGA